MIQGAKSPSCTPRVLITADKTIQWALVLVTVTEIADRTCDSLEGKRGPFTQQNRMASASSLGSDLHPVFCCFWQQEQGGHGVEVLDGWPGAP